MKLEQRNNYHKEYRCSLTREFDKMSGILEEEHYRLYHHYILADEYCMNNKCLAIRIPGGTVGGIWINDNNVIIDIIIDRNYVVKTYPENVNDLMKKYIGESIDGINISNHNSETKR